MANIASSKKDARRSAVRAVANKSARSAVKTRVTRARKAIAEGAEDLSVVVVTALSSLDRAASKGILHRNNAARRKSRLVKRLKTAANTPAVAARTEKKAPAKAAAKGSAKSSAKAPSKAAKPAAKAASKKPAAKK
jgi:small subunit ribosomal protein S20